MREMKTQSDAAEKMAYYHYQIQNQRHQAELQQLANQQQETHQELARYRNRENELTSREMNIAERERNPPKARVITREIVNEPFNNPSSSSWEVPMALPPPTRAESLATLQSKAPPPPTRAESLSSLQSKRPPPSPPAKAPPKAKAKAQAKAKPRARPLPTTRVGLIGYIENRGRILTNDETQPYRRGGLPVVRLRQIARNMN